MALPTHAGDADHRTALHDLSTPEAPARESTAQDASSRVAGDAPTVPAAPVDSVASRVPSHAHAPSPAVDHPPAGAHLRIHTDVMPAPGRAQVTATTTASDASARSAHELPPKSPLRPISRTPSLRQAMAHSLQDSGALSSAPNSALSSPMLNAMADVTPLPSPLMSADSPGPWRKLIATQASRASPNTDGVLVTTNGESITAALLHQTKRKAYQGLGGGPHDAAGASDAHGHARNRSVSEYVPDDVQLAKQRHVVSGSHVPPADDHEAPMRREPHLAVQRGLAPMPRPPTPPASRTGESDSDSSVAGERAAPGYQYFDALTQGDAKRRRWRGLKQLGEGTFSRVVLATAASPHDTRSDELEPKKLVAIKICEHGPKGGASEERVEMSLKRELDILKSIRHPSVVHLKAWSVEETRAILVLSYCPGGDLFEVASEHRHLLVPSLLRRIFAELVAAVQYLHQQRIVHRDIKLENVLVNLPQHDLAQERDWSTYEYAVITLTDLGLSRRVADDEKLTTRCGSDDYAAPEVIMGQPYDGRAVDAWSLGVLLYALLECRLPFDPPPGMSEAHKQRSRTSHRIARVEWRWVLFAGDEGDHEGNAAKFDAAGLTGAMEVTEGLLKRARSRWTMAQVAAQDWVRGGLRVETLKFREEDIPDEVV